MEEVWKDVKGYEGLYQVSSLGRVKSVGRVVIMKDGVKRPIRERILKPQLNKKTGYCQVKLAKNGEKQTKNIYVLVAVAFLGHVPNGHVIVPDHIDDDKTNNRADNLRLITQRENTSGWQTNTQTGEPNIYTQKNGTFRVRFWFKGSSADIGTYKTIAEAIPARNKARDEIKAEVFIPRPSRVRV